MRFSLLSRKQKKYMAVFSAAFLVFITGGIFLLFSDKDGDTVYPEDMNDDTAVYLADGMEYYPKKILLNQPVEDFILYDKDGNKTKLSSYYGKNIIIIFWTSWCRYCKEELSYMNEYEKLIAAYDDVEILLLNRLDNEKETVEQAEEYLKTNRINTKSYYDYDFEIYNALGVQVIPTLLGINAEGILKLAYPDVLGGVKQLEATIDYIRNGGAYATEIFITEYLMGSNGGVYTNYMDLDGVNPSGHDVLSESQGLIMEHAVLTKNKGLFDKTLDFVMEYMVNEDALAGWIVINRETDSPVKSRVNSLIDDLRIYRALVDANQLWAGYEEYKEQWKYAILKYNTISNRLVDFYDFKLNKKANRITLCFADFSALMELTDKGNSSKLYKNVYKLVTGGYISNKFPLYYSWYDYNKEKYSMDDLNMAEAMVTLNNLASVGELKEETIQWLKDTMKNGGIKARYTVKGKIVNGYNYESTAIYATVMMIASKIRDNELYTMAIARMELMRINNTGIEFNGSFGVGDGTDIYSYDQCMALLAYVYSELEQ